MKQVLFCIFAILSFVGFSQETLSELLTIHNTKAIPYITVQELAMPKTKAIIPVHLFGLSASVGIFI